MKRYGRNQKRVSRRRIRELERRLEMESTARMYRMHGDELDVRVLSYSVTEDGSAGEIARRSATLIIDANEPGVNELANMNSIIKFMGHSYRTEHLHSMDGFGMSSFVTFQLDLIGVTG